MSNFIMMIGIPGSGKSTIAHKLLADFPDAHIHSSDDIREELYGTADDQSDPAKVFAIMETRTIADLSNNIDVIYDATNISSKKRKALLVKLPKNTFKIAYYIKADLETCLRRIAGRDRKVPEFVLKRMLAQLEEPSFSEGFNKITKAFATKEGY